MIEVDKMGIMMLKKFVKYVSQNMLGMVGMSVYILADTYFISVAVGTDGITALNLVLPVYNMIFAIGAMMGVGSAIRLVIERNQEHPNADGYFFHALSWALIVGLLFMFVGIFFPDDCPAWRGCRDRCGREKLYAYFYGFCAVFYVELYLQCFCAQRWESIDRNGCDIIQQSVQYCI